MPERQHQRRQRQHNQLLRLAHGLGAAPAPSPAGSRQGPSLGSTVTLRSGVVMPLFGLGTFKAEMGGQCLDACTTALELGYRMLDTATMYGNELEVRRRAEMPAGVDY
jgi:hypothetical protein